MRAGVLALVLLTGCGLATQVRPTPKGVLVAEASIGGPAVIEGGAPLPLPLSAVGVSWGFGDRSDLSTHFHVTTLVAQKLAGFDVGGSWLALEADGARPALTVGWRGYVFTDFHSGAIGLFDGSLAASWNLSRRVVPFVSLVGQLSAPLQLDFAPAVGAQFRFQRFTLQAELRWFAPTQDARGAAVKWLSPYKQGAVGLVISGRYALADGLIASEH